MLKQLAPLQKWGSIFLFLTTEMHFYYYRYSKVPKKGTTGYQYWFNCDQFLTPTPHHQRVVSDLFNLYTNITISNHFLAGVVTYLFLSRCVLIKQTSCEVFILTSVGCFPLFPV